MKETVIVKYNDIFRDQLILVWEKSVRATHDFLIHSDIDYFKSIVAGLDFNAFQVFCLVQENIVLGFIGVADRKIEMLFLSPEYIGKGFGQSLVQFAMDKLHTNAVDVNEQNIKAVKFYLKFGFVTYARTAKDSEGKDYPILKMKLKEERV